MESITEKIPYIDSVLGEVSNPGRYAIDRDKFTILEEPLNGEHYGVGFALDDT